MKKFYLTIPLLFSFIGCAPLQCGLDEKTFNELSLRGKEEICKEYNSKQAEIEKVREQRRLEEAKKEREIIALEKQKVENEYSKEYNKIFIKIESGQASFYGEYEPIKPIGFEIVQGEVKRISIYDRHYQYFFVWVYYYGNELYWNIQPKYEDLSSYIDFELVKNIQHDKLVSRNEIHYGLNHSNIKGKYRGLEIKNLKFSVKEIRPEKNIIIINQEPRIQRIEVPMPRIEVLR